MTTHGLLVGILGLSTSICDPAFVPFVVAIVGGYVFEIYVGF